MVLAMTELWDVNSYMGSQWYLLHDTSERAPACRLVLHLPTRDGWKAELTSVNRHWNGRKSNSQLLDHKSNVIATTAPSHPYWYQCERHLHVSSSCISLMNWKTWWMSLACEQFMEKFNELKDLVNVTCVCPVHGEVQWTERLGECNVRVRSSWRSSMNWKTWWMSLACEQFMEKFNELKDLVNVTCVCAVHGEVQWTERLGECVGSHCVCRDERQTEQWSWYHGQAGV